jgi:hypothetical protein
VTISPDGIERRPGRTDGRLWPKGEECFLMPHESDTGGTAAAVFQLFETDGPGAAGGDPHLRSPDRRWLDRSSGAVVRLPRCTCRQQRVPLIGQRGRV